MRRLFAWMLLSCCLAAAWPAAAATGRVLKVLPHFLDLKGRASLTPSLYDRDAYQALLRMYPTNRSGIRFDVQWKTRGTVWEPVTLRVELRGVAVGSLPKQKLLQQTVAPGGWFSHWTGLRLDGADYQELGEVTAWRVTLWEGQQLLSEQKSFLW